MDFVPRLRRKIDPEGTLVHRVDAKELCDLTARDLVALSHLVERQSSVRERTIEPCLHDAAPPGHLVTRVPPQNQRRSSLAARRHNHADLLDRVEGDLLCERAEFLYILLRREFRADQQFHRSKSAIPLDDVRLAVLLDAK